MGEGGAAHCLPRTFVQNATVINSAPSLYIYMFFMSSMTPTFNTARNVQPPVQGDAEHAGADMHSTHECPLHCTAGLARAGYVPLSSAGEHVRGLFYLQRCMTGPGLISNRPGGLISAGGLLSVSEGTWGLRQRSGLT